MVLQSLLPANCGLLAECSWTQRAARFARSHPYLRLLLVVPLNADWSADMLFHEAVDAARLVFSQVLMLVLVAVCFHFQDPGEDGAFHSQKTEYYCQSLLTEDSCLRRHTLFDATQTYCQWQSLAPLVNFAVPAEATQCSYRSPHASMHTVLTVVSLCSVAAALLEPLLIRLFDICGSSSSEVAPDLWKRGPSVTPMPMMPAPPHGGITTTGAKEEGNGGGAAAALRLAEQTASYKK
jgi:hypothetical protein